MLISNKRNLKRDVFAIFFMDFFSVFTLGLVLASTNFWELFKGSCKYSGHYSKFVVWNPNFFGFSSNNLVKNQLNLRLGLTYPSKLLSPQGVSLGQEIQEEFVFQSQKNQGSC